MINRYDIGTDFPQPRRLIKPAVTDILHPFKMGERLDNLAEKYYNDPTISYIIMCANPDYYNELEIPFGSIVRVPWPLKRVLSAWGIQKEI